MLGTEDEWVTVDEILSHSIFEHVRVGDIVAVDVPDEDDWIIGEVKEIATYKGRYTRWIERRRIDVQVVGEDYPRTFYEHRTSQLLFQVEEE